MTEKQIQSHIYIWKQASGFSAPNIKYYQWESDFLFITNHGYVHEYEIKVTLADFKNDFKKTGKHNMLAAQDHGRYPNCFWYACPENLIKESELPEYAGLVYVSPKTFYPWIIKRAPRLKGSNRSNDNLKEDIFKATYYRYWSRHVDAHNDWK